MLSVCRRERCLVSSLVHLHARVRIERRPTSNPYTSLQTSQQSGCPDQATPDDVVTNVCCGPSLNHNFRVARSLIPFIAHLCLEYLRYHSSGFLSRTHPIFGLKKGDPPYLQLKRKALVSGYLVATRSLVFPDASVAPSTQHRKQN